MTERIYTEEEPREYEKIYKNTTGKVADTLLPCPFCGGKVQIVKASDDLDEPIFDYYMITRGGGKNGCRCRHFMESDRFYTEDKELARIAKANLIEAWNRRADVRD